MEKNDVRKLHVTISGPFDTYFPKQKYKPAYREFLDAVPKRTIFCSTEHSGVGWTVNVKGTAEDIPLSY